MKRIVFVVGPAVAAAALGLGIACSSQESSSEHVGQSTAPLTIGTNHQAVGYNMHYASGAPGRNPASGLWHWVTAFNNCSQPTGLPCSVSPAGLLQDGVGWSVSTDLTGSSWTPNLPPAGWEHTNWPVPGTPSAGGSFAGWNGDTTIAQIGGSSTTAPDGSHLVLVSLTSSDVSESHGVPSDVAMLTSSDGGNSWGNPKYVSQPTGGGVTDQPYVVSNASSPYSTFAAWMNNDYTGLHRNGWINSIDSVTFQPGSSSSAPASWNLASATGCAGCAKTILGLNNNLFTRPKLAVSTVSGCSDGPHEVVYVAWSNDPYGRICSVPTMPATQSISWELAVFDNTANQWSGPYPIDTDATWPSCVGGVQQKFNDNLPEPALAAGGNFVGIVHNQSTPRGTRIRYSPWAMTCSGTTLTALPLGIYQSPDYCYRIGGSGWCNGASGDGGGGNGLDGGNVVNDQWGATIAFQAKAGVGQLFISWYDTSGDSANHVAKINGAYATGGFSLNPFLSGSTWTISQISNSWPDNHAYWWDYQSIATEPSTHSFLASWGGDDHVNPSGVWTSVVTNP